MRIAGGKLYTGADLGFDAQVIAASGIVEGLTVPWIAGFAFSKVTLIARLTSATPNLNVRVRVFDFDGVTQLNTVGGQLSVFTGINNQLGMYFAGLDTLRSTVGATVVGTVPAILGAPYARFSLQNADAVNPVTVTFTATLQ
ncbi:MAG: hypothetical protein ACREI9_04710 [Nitrospiraceae bacterium]